MKDPSYGRQRHEGPVELGLEAHPWEAETVTAGAGVAGIAIAAVAVVPGTRGSLAAVAAAVGEEAEASAVSARSEEHEGCTRSLAEDQEMVPAKEVPGNQEDRAAAAVEAVATSLAAGHRPPT